MTAAYLDPTALIELVSPGHRGRQVADIVNTCDAVVTLASSEIEVPALVGRSINRVGWAWIINTVSLTTWTDEMRDVALDLAWLGAPALIAMHTACAVSIAPEVVLTSSDVAASWFEMAELQVVLVSDS